MSMKSMLSIVFSETLLLSCVYLAGGHIKSNIYFFIFFFTVDNSLTVLLIIVLRYMLGQGNPLNMGACCRKNS